ncbi:MAG: hypothetical protein ACETWM_17345 [Candidatus Lokiarchaeia archaeon]
MVIRIKKKKEDSREISIVCNMVRPSSASPDLKILNGPSDKYPTEDWLLDYFSVERDRSLSKRSVTCRLPRGYEKSWNKHGDLERPEGPIYKVRAWGMEFCVYYLKWCDVYQKIRDSIVNDAKSSKACFDLNAIGWDLPGYFIIGSKEHPFYATSPAQKRYVYDSWCTFEQALSEVEKRKGD